MKKRIIILSFIFWLMVLPFLILNTKEDKSFIIDGIKYSTILDGNYVSRFPSKGNYEVNVECENAKGEWNYTKWVAEISNVTGYPSCSISFTSSEGTKLNEYLINLAKNNQQQGIGKIVNEIDDYYKVTGVGTTLGDATGLNVPTDYLNYQEYYSNSFSSTSGTVTNGVFNGSGNTWVTDTSKMTSGTYYHLSFEAPSEGFYQICYNFGSGNTKNYLYIYNGVNLVELPNGTALIASSSSSKTGCVNIGKVASGNKVRIVQYAYDSISSLSFAMSSLPTEIITYDTGYRYEGKDPNNYIYFNNELWRIIGVFDSASHGISNTNLVKIIRNDSIGGYVWDKSNTTNWSNSSLYYLLNNNYYNATDGTNSGYCYMYVDYINGNVNYIARNCDYTTTGLQDDYRNMVQTVTWYLGGPITYRNKNCVPSECYAYERDSTKKASSNSSSTTGNVGLMYLSDYGYSVLSTGCARTNYISDYYNTSTCVGNNWLRKEETEWSITPNGGNSIWLCGKTTSGYSSNNSSRGFNVRPVLYLKSNVVRYAGDGSISNPYQIRLES